MGSIFRLNNYHNNIKYLGDIMQLYKYETHLHTSQGSQCSASSGAEQVDFLKSIGYDGCFITDHFFGGNTAVDRRLPWDVKIHLFCQGYEDAKKRGDEIGFKVFFGLEYGWHATEMLTYGVDKQFLLDHPEIEYIPIKQYIDLVHECGGFVVHPHPFREAGYIDTIRLFPRIVDGVEVENASHRDGEFNTRARAYAESYHLPMTGGSDTHNTWWYTGGGIALESPLESAADYLDRLKNGQITKILTRTEEYFREYPGDTVWNSCKRPDITMLPADMRKKAEKFYASLDK